MAADSSADSCDLFITLVHGTWARGFFPPLREKGRWFADGSDFRKNLADALSKHGISFRMCSFLWSGANSVQERDKAARELAEHVRAKQVDYSSSTQLLIAHSHGGNVALRAVDKIEVTRDENVLIATIATPFVEILEAKLSPKENRRFSYLAASMPVIAFILLFNFLEKTLGIPGRIVGPISMVLAALLFRLLYRAMRIEVDELVKLTSLSSSVRKHPLLILRAVDDEASLSLAAAAIGNRLSALIGLWSYRILVANMILLPPVFMFVFFSDTPEYFGWKSLVALAIASLGAALLWALEVSIFGGLIFLLAPGICKSAFGRELLFNYQSCHINSQSAPDSIDRDSEFHFGSQRSSWGMMLTLDRADEGRRGLHHGLYNHPQCAELIAAWVAANHGCPERITTRDLAHLHPESHGRGARP